MVIINEMLMNFQVLGNMKHCILATDLALFFPNKVFSLKDLSSHQPIPIIQARLSNLVRENTFSWDVPQHRYSLAISVSRYTIIRCHSTGTS